MYPLRLEPIFHYRIWGGRRLERVLDRPLPGDDPIGEAWVLSDRDDYASVVAEGPLQGRTIQDLITEFPKRMMGDLADRFPRFPLLLKFLDAREMLSVQVHPSDDKKEFLPPGERGKTEAWVVLDAEPDSRIYAGLNPGTTVDDLRQGLANGTVEDDLAHFAPKPGDGIFIPAGTVHALGGGVVVFEVQQNSDVTFRLYDWNRVDAKTGKTRELHIDKALACIEFPQGPVGPVVPTPESAARELMFSSEFFDLWRVRSDAPFVVGSPSSPRILVCIEGQGQLEHEGTRFPVKTGDTWLLPAAIGQCPFEPDGVTTIFEIGIPG